MTDQAKSNGSGPTWWLAAVLAVSLVVMVAIPMGAMTMIAGLVALSSAQKAAQAGDCGAGESGVVYASSGDVRLPVVGKFTYTSPYGMRLHPILGVYRLHAGMDLVSVGDVVAPQAATVQSVTMGDPGAGNFVVLDHGGGITSRYLHLESVAVRVGQKLRVGQKIGVEGTTGGSTGVHLHFEIRKDGQPSDPAAWLKKHGVSVPPLGGTGTAPGAGERADDGEVEADMEVVSRQVSGSSFDLPKPGTNRRHTPGVKPMSVPPQMKKAYESAAAKYGIPWQLLAGIGMEETHHWRIKAVSSAGAMGPMQMTGPTIVDFGRDGNGDGTVDILDPMDAAHSSANLLVQNGALESADGVKRAVARYNPGAGPPDNSWYVNDVLHYAHAYGSGTVGVSAGDDCGRVDASMASNQTTECPKTNSPAEEGLQPHTLNTLRCGAQAAPWVTTMHGVGQRAGATEHDDGLAVDFMIPKHDTAAGNARGWQLAKWLEKNARRLKIRYIIFDEKIWNIERQDEGWRPYTRYGPAADDTLAHRDHVHVSSADTA